MVAFLGGDEVRRAFNKSRLAALADGAAGPVAPSPAQPGKKPIGSSGPVYPTSDELKKYKALGRSAKLGDAVKMQSFWELHNILHSRLAAAPETWTDADFRRRVHCEAELS